MAVFKCKMCGGTLEISNNESVAVCEYCGTTQTLPRLDDEKRANLYDRANHFRRNNEYDKAMSIYEQILNEDTTDAEAYWSRVLCRYGIEYVEDPATRKRMPTVNRAQFTSVLADEDYKSALRHADGYQQSIYEAEAFAIDKIQKGILEISQKEEPFDVFICYKETDNNGRRTQDSVLANDLYHQLKQEGFKVFFSRITLEDKLGSAYEPYIFAALNSAKVMVVLGTKPEYFNAVWVRNEWSRYLSLIKNGAKKTLIPAYRDMDPYDLPEEFSHLQAQDMAKLGFMQDLIRGIKKITAPEEKKVLEKTVIVAGNSDGAAATASLLKRAFLFLEDGEWDNANEYCERVLDIDPECAQAYIGKLMVELGIRKEENIVELDNAAKVTENSNYQKALRFAEGDYRTALEEYPTQIRNRIEQKRLSTAYEKAMSAYKKAKAAMEKQQSDLFREAADLFSKVSGYLDANEKRKECLEQAELARKEAIYKNAVYLENSGGTTEAQLSNVRKAVEQYEKILNYKDAALRKEQCEQKIEELQRKKEKEAAANRRRVIKISLISACAIIAVIAIYVLATTLVIPTIKYNTAMKLFENKSFEEAYAAFIELEDFKDSAKKAEEVQSSRYNEAMELYQNGEYAEAEIIFKALGDFSSSSLMAELTGKWCIYEEALECYNQQDYEGAYDKFSQLDYFQDSLKYARESLILYYKKTGNNEDAGILLAEEGRYSEAYELLCPVVADYIGQKLYLHAFNILNTLNATYLETAESQSYYYLYAKCQVGIISLASEGDIVTFGEYLQGSEWNVDMEPITWVVADINQEQALLVSEYALNLYPYNSEGNYCTWAESEIREYCNSFFEVAFPYGKEYIADTYISDGEYDKVFLLTAEEMEELDQFGYSQTKPTEYLLELFDLDGDMFEGNYILWTRDVGLYGEDGEIYINDFGHITHIGPNYSADGSYLFRPAIWVNFE